MLPPSEVTPARSNAFRYSTTSALRSSSVIGSVVAVMAAPLWTGLAGWLGLGDPFGVRRGGRPVGQGEDRAEGGPAGPAGRGRGGGGVVGGGGAPGAAPAAGAARGARGRIGPRGPPPAQ